MYICASLRQLFFVCFISSAVKKSILRICMDVNNEVNIIIYNYQNVIRKYYKTFKNVFRHKLISPSLNFFKTINLKNWLLIFIAICISQIVALFHHVALYNLFLLIYLIVSSLLYNLYS